MGISQEIKILSFSFLLIFFGFSGVQQFITPFFSEIGIPDVGFRALILIYLFFLLSGPLSAIIVSKYGPKRCMMAASVFYGLFILTIVSKNIFFIYPVSSLLGIAASLLWTGQHSYLITASNEKVYGASSGYFNMLQAFGSATGTLLLGFLIVKLSFGAPFIFYALLPFVGILLLSRLTDLKVQKQANQLVFVRKLITNTTAIRLAAFYIAFLFFHGLAIGMIPIDIKNTLSIAWIGVMSFIFLIIPILFSYIFGKIYDIKGRKGMIITAYVIGALGLFLLYFQSALTLIFGIILVAFAYAIFKPMSFSLVGDVTSKENLVSLTAFLWMAQNIGILSALLVSMQMQTKAVYLVGLAVLVASLIIQLPLLRLGTQEVKERLA